MDVGVLAVGKLVTRGHLRSLPTIWGDKIRSLLDVF